MKNGNLSAHVP
jgi:hypothetical protein